MLAWHGWYVNRHDRFFSLFTLGFSGAYLWFIDPWMRMIQARKFESIDPIVPIAMRTRRASVPITDSQLSDSGWLGFVVQLPR